jgi:hypothetical protein
VADRNSLGWPISLLTSCLADPCSASCRLSPCRLLLLYLFECFSCRTGDANPFLCLLIIYTPATLYVFCTCMYYTSSQLAFFAWPIVTLRLPSALVLDKHTRIIAKSIGSCQSRLPLFFHQADILLTLVWSKSGVNTSPPVSEYDGFKLRNSVTLWPLSSYWCKLLTAPWI